MKVSQTENDQYSLALIANVDISDADLSAYKGFPKETLIKKLNFQSTHLDKDKEDYFWKDKYLPMYGESDPKHISKVPQVWGTIYMIRSVAKVTIDIKSNDQNLVFGELYIHNAVSKGRYASDVHSSFLEGNNTPSNTKVTLPDFNTNETQYTNWVEFVDLGIQSATPIILSENEGGSRDDVDKTTCFVLGLKKDEDSKISYYRLDIPKMSESGGFDKEKTEPILRNRHYVVKVTHVEGEGAENPDDALRKDDQIEATLYVVEWNEINSDIEFEGNPLDPDEFLKFTGENQSRNIYFNYKDEHDSNSAGNNTITKTISLASNIIGSRIAVENPEVNPFAASFYDKADDVIAEEFSLSITLDKDQWERALESPKPYFTLYVLVKSLDQINKMRIPLRVYFPKQNTEMIDPNDKNFQVETKGSYYAGVALDASSYLSVNIHQNVFTQYNGDPKTVKISTDAVNDYSFTGSATSKVIDSISYYPYEITSSGTPLKEGEDLFTYTIEFSEKANTKEGTINKIKLIGQFTNPVTPKPIEMAKPIAENLRILFIADDYAYDGKPGHEDKYVNLSKLLRSPSIFTLDLLEKNSSLVENELIRVKPFEFRWYATKYNYNFDNEPRNIIYWAPSIRDAKTIEDQYIKGLDSFDIVFYIRSSNKNESRRNFESICY
nr:hypothetical protein [Bacteroides coprosuis]